jgi:hypothetical protein
MGRQVPLVITFAELSKREETEERKKNPSSNKTKNLHVVFLVEYIHNKYHNTWVKSVRLKKLVVVYIKIWHWDAARRFCPLPPPKPLHKFRRSFPTHPPNYSCLVAKKVALDQAPSPVCDLRTRPQAKEYSWKCTEWKCVLMFVIRSTAELCPLNCTSLLPVLSHTEPYRDPIS